MDIYINKFIGIFIIFFGYFIFVLSMRKKTKYTNFLFLISFVMNMIGVLLIFYFTLR